MSQDVLTHRYSFKTGFYAGRIRLRMHVRFQPVRLAACAAMAGMPRACRRRGLATRSQTGLLAEQLDLLAPHQVVQDHAHEAHGLPGDGEVGSVDHQPAEDLH